MKLSEQQRIFTKNIAVFILKLFDLGYSVTMGEVYRTAQQADWYAEKGLGIKNSLHCDRLACDLNIFSPEGRLLEKKEELAFAGKIWESMNSLNRWGGNFITREDTDHFEMQKEG